MNNLTKEAVEKYIQAWGEMGSRWGINKTMSQIHALMTISENPLTTDAVMEELKISRGHANMNLRALVDWGLARRVYLKGQRKEYFESEKDVWKMFCTVVRERKRREIEPVIRTLNECLKMTQHDKSAAFISSQLANLLDFASSADFILGKIANQEKSKMLPNILKLLSADR